MSKLKMGYVGCGFMAQKVHLPNILSLGEAELLAVAEVRQELGRKVQARLGVPRLYRDHRELAADREIQAVGVSGHFAGQGEIAIELLLAGKDVFMEKPMAVSVEQAQRILDAQRRSGRRLMIAYMKRYDPGNLLVKRLLEELRISGELGEIRFVRNHGFCGDWTAGLDAPMETTDEKPPAYDVPWPTWLPEKWRNGYLGYLQQYTHNVNLLRWFLDAGDDVQVLSTHLDDAQGMRGVVVLKVAGITAVIESGGIPYHGWDEHTQLYFDRGWIKTDAPPLLLRNMPAGVEVYRADKPDKSLSQFFPSGGRSWSYKAEMQHFVECLRSGQPFPSPAEDALADVRTLEEIYKAHVEAQSRQHD